MPALVISFAFSSEIIVSFATITSPVCGLTTSPIVYLPTNLSSSVSIGLVSPGSLISETQVPFGVIPKLAKQSSSLTITECATSTSLLVK